VPELDSLRGLAALAIVVFHAKPSRLPYGWSAVDLFFVLSGYLITGIILRNGDSPGFLARFYARRGLRVWPVYFLTLFAAAAAGPWLPRPNVWRGLPYILTFTQGVPLHWGGDAPVFSWYLCHTWTLAIEEQFYLLWPALLLLTRRRGVVPLAIAWTVGSALLRANGMPASVLAARGDGLALGGLLAGLIAATGADRRPEVRARLVPWFRALVATSLTALAVIRWQAGPAPDSPAAMPWPGLTVLGVSIFWLGVVGWVVCRAGTPRSRALRLPALQRLGTVSYGLYLYHFPILFLSVDIARAYGYQGPQLWREGPALALCFVAAWASWAFIERPLLTWKDRLSYRPSSPVPGQLPSRPEGLRRAATQGSHGPVKATIQGEETACPQGRGASTASSDRRDRP
jgi:peptidoglycan/LPS O-acetylase OafA/YrhL